MKPYLKREIDRALVKIDPKPKPGMINEYADFVRLKETFTYYDFNSQIFEKLIDIAYDLVINKKRFDKRRLFLAIKLYYKKRPSKYVLPQDKVDHLFNIFKIAALEKDRKVLFPINHLLLGIEFNNSQVSWLIENSMKSETVLNRLLHHPIKNTEISEWAVSHFPEKRLRGRRVELLGWLLDVKPDYRLDNQTVINDFEYLINEDKKEYASFLFEQGQEKIRSIKQMKNINAYFGIDVPEEEITEELSIHKETSFFHKFKRQVFYERIYDETFNVQSTRAEFMKKLDYHTSRIQCWGIAYSHLNIRLKETMLQELFREDLIWTFINIATKLKSARFLQWLKK